jgi:hypothetical protein
MEAGGGRCDHASAVAAHAAADADHDVAEQCPRRGGFVPSRSQIEYHRHLMPRPATPPKPEVPQLIYYDLDEYEDELITWDHKANKGDSAAMAQLARGKQRGTVFPALQPCDLSDDIQSPALLSTGREGDLWTCPPQPRLLPVAVGPDVSLAHFAMCDAHVYCGHVFGDVIDCSSQYDVITLKCPDAWVRHCTPFVSNGVLLLAGHLFS